VDPRSTAELALHRNGSEPGRTYDQLVSDAAREIAESRGPIEQVKGMLMFVYRIDEQQAWELLKWRSQETNVKLRALAVQLAARHPRPRLRRELTWTIFA
jgi:AmiR/NasT family two-component response regulator